MDRFFLFCFKSCLKGENDHEYYTLLDIKDEDKNNVSKEFIKRKYRNASIKFHPDKLAQRGLTVSKDDAENFVKIKEAYEVSKGALYRSMVPLNNDSTHVYIIMIRYSYDAE